MISAATLDSGELLLYTFRGPSIYIFPQLNCTCITNAVCTTDYLPSTHSPISPSHQHTYFHWNLSASGARDPFPSY